jgi:tetrahydromethanopterin S-methyltransferase subunit E
MILTEGNIWRQIGRHPAILAAHIIIVILSGCLATYSIVLFVYFQKDDTNFPFPKAVLVFLTVGNIGKIQIRSKIRNHRNYISRISY